MAEVAEARPFPQPDGPQTVVPQNRIGPPPEPAVPSVPGPSTERIKLSELEGLRLERVDLQNRYAAEKAAELESRTRRLQAEFNQIGIEAMKRQEALQDKIRLAEIEGREAAEALRRAQVAMGDVVAEIALGRKVPSEVLRNYRVLYDQKLRPVEIYDATKVSPMEG